MTVGRADAEGVVWFREAYCEPCKAVLTDTAHYWAHVTADDHKRRSEKWKQMRAEAGK